MGGAQTKPAQGGQSEESEQKKDCAVTIHYWGGVKSRSFYGNVFLAATGHLNSVALATQYPYPKTPQYAALKKFEQKSAWNCMPFLVDTDTGAKIGESMAIIRYLSRKFGTDPESHADYALYQQCIDWVGGTHDLLSGANYAPKRFDAFNEVFETKLPPSLAGLESTFVGDGPWFGSCASPGDYAVAACLQIIEDLNEGLIARYPKLWRLHAHVFALESVQEYAKTVPHDYFDRTKRTKETK